jgi:MGT family glycosyltransferase
MADVLIPLIPVYGHVVPLLAVGRGLLARGHRVTVLTGRKYAALVTASGLQFRPLPASVDFDDDDLDGWLPGRGQGGRLAAGRHDILGLFIGPLPVQHSALVTELAAGGYDAVVADAAYLGVLPTVLAVPVGDRVPIFGVSVTPLSVTSVDTAPFGSAMQPGRSILTRLRNRHINHVLRTGPLRPIQTAMDDALAPFGVPAGAVSYFDHTTYLDLCWQLAPAEFEYPRRELPSTVRFIGPLPPDDAGHPSPSWWSDLDDLRPVVHVTQGTVDNHDLGTLLATTFSALADEDVWVVGSTGGRPVADLLDRTGGALPANGRVAPFLPYSRLLPRTAVMVTNGGYGGVTQALRIGVPLVVAGATEEKPEVAARVAWSGTGINLRSGRPGPRQIRGAVRAVLETPRYRVRAEQLRQQIATLPDPLATIAGTVESVTDLRQRTLDLAKVARSG